MTINMIYVVAVVVLLFGATVFAHELGHFLSARLLGMVADVFSIGFGPAIWKKKIGAVVYQIAAIPVGGYVSLPQMDPQLGHSAESGGEQSSGNDNKGLPSLAPWKKIIVAISGPAGNIALAVLLAWIVYWTGKPSTPAERAAVVGFVMPDSPAYVAGILTGDEILSVNNRPVSNWNEMLQENSRFDQVELKLKRGDRFKRVTAATDKNMIGLRAIRGMKETSICKVELVDPGSSAGQAGIMAGDIVREFDGTKVLGVDHLIALVSGRPDVRTPMLVIRDDKKVSIMVTPRVDPDLGRAVIGIRFDPMAFDYDQRVHIRPGVQLMTHATAILRVVRSLLTPREARATSEGLGGPFIIIFMFVEMVRRSLVTALWFTCFLNVNLAILNLLPIPVLDGGHVVFSLWEMIFRRPPHPKIVIWLSNIFAGLLIFVFILLSGRDLQRIGRIMNWFRPSAPSHEATNNATHGP